MTDFNKICLTLMLFLLANLQGYSQFQKINIYPNPAKDYIIVDSPSEFSKLVVINMLGKQVLQVPYKQNQYYFINHLNEGIYLVKILSNDGKIIVTRRIHKKLSGT